MAVNHEGYTMRCGYIPSVERGYKNSGFKVFSQRVEAVLSIPACVLVG
jgi:hypothetical protein